MASNPFNGDCTVDGGSFSTTDIAALVEKMEVGTEYAQIDLTATLGNDWNTVAQGSGTGTLDCRLRLELDTNYGNFMSAWDARTTLTVVVRPRTGGAAAVGNPQNTVTFQLPTAPPIPTEADAVLVWEFTVRVLTWTWTDSVVTVTRPS